MMDEAVLLTVLWRDEAKALRVIEPLDRASGACHFLLLVVTDVIGVGRAARPTTVCVDSASTRARLPRHCVRLERQPRKKGAGQRQPPVFARGYKIAKGAPKKQGMAPSTRPAVKRGHRSEHGRRLLLVYVLTCPAD